MDGMTKEHLGRPAIRLGRGPDRKGEPTYAKPIEEGFIEAISEDGQYVKFAKVWLGITFSRWYEAKAIRMVGQVAKAKDFLLA